MANRHKKKIPNITNHQENANQNHNAISPHACQNGHHQKEPEITSDDDDIEKKEPLCTIGKNVNWHNQYGKQYGGSSKN